MSPTRRDSLAGDANVPKHFSCPITHELFVDPVIFADGHTYERDAIATWLRRRETSPMTVVFRGDESCSSNHAMRSAGGGMEGDPAVDVGGGGGKRSGKASAAARTTLM